MQPAPGKLIHARFLEGTGDRQVITLHRHNAIVESTRVLGVAVHPDGPVTGIESSKGVYIGRSIVGYTWYVGPRDQPSPVHFGDSLVQIEAFILDEIDRQASPQPAAPFLLGEEQGAAMALAMAAANPDLLSGVIAIDPYFPTVPGWEPPLAPLNGLPILLAGGPTDDSLPETLRSWGADVTIGPASRNSDFEGGLAEWLSRQPVRIAPSAD